MLYMCHISEYLKKARLKMLSKNDLTQVVLFKIRPIAILPHVLKVLEKVIKIKSEDQGNYLFSSWNYQVGFKTGNLLKIALR